MPATHRAARVDRQEGPRPTPESLEWRAVKTLPEICEICRREVQALERVIVLLTREEKRVAEVTFRESVEGVYCMECALEEERCE